MKILKSLAMYILSLVKYVEWDDLNYIWFNGNIRFLKKMRSWIIKIGKYLSLGDSGSSYTSIWCCICWSYKSNKLYLHVIHEFDLYRSLKLWMVLRLYGSENLRNFIRDHVNLAKHFEDYVAQDPRFEVTY